MDYKVLQTELGDAAYQSMSDTEAAAALNDKSKAAAPLGRMDAATFGALLRLDDWKVAQPEQQTYLTALMAAGAVDLASAGVVTDLQTIFADGSPTRNALSLALTQKTSRAQILGLGAVLPEDVKRARGGKW